MIVSITQPAYLPWLGYFHRIAMSDLHIVLDHVQFEKNSFSNRNRIRTKTDWMWLTVPVRTRGRFGSLTIKELELVEGDRWTSKHWNALRTNYSSATNFKQHADFFETFYNGDWRTMGPLLRESTSYLLDALGVNVPIRFSSDMDPTLSKDELVLELCKKSGATTYISGPLGRQYLREELFSDSGIYVTYHDYKHPTYKQAFPGFVSELSAIDLLFNCGPESRDILMTTSRP